MNAGSNDLTLISDFNGPAPRTFTIASGGTEPVAALMFPGNGGFNDLIVANSGDGVFSLLEGGPGGLTLTSTETMPDLPDPTALALSLLTDDQVEFYAATAGLDAAFLVGFPLGGTAAASGTAVAQLVPLQESALALVGTLLTLTIETPLVNPGGPETVAAEAAVTVGPGPSVGQGLFSVRGDRGTGGGDAEESSESEEVAAPPVPTEVPAWERLFLGLDDAFEQARRAFLDRFFGGDEADAPRDGPEAPRGESPPVPGEPRGDRSPAPLHPTSGGPDAISPHQVERARVELIDAVIDTLGSQGLSPSRMIATVGTPPAVPVRLGPQSDDIARHDEVPLCPPPGTGQGELIQIPVPLLIVALGGGAARPFVVEGAGAERSRAVVDDTIQSPTTGRAGGMRKAP